jgi:hypothetical protein
MLAGVGAPAELARAIQGLVEVLQVFVDAILIIPRYVCNTQGRFLMIPSWHLNGHVFLDLGKHIRAGVCRYHLRVMLIDGMQDHLVVAAVAHGLTGKAAHFHDLSCLLIHNLLILGE